MLEILHLHFRFHLPSPNPLRSFTGLANAVMATDVVLPSQWKAKRRGIFQSVFQTGGAFQTPKSAPLQSEVPSNQADLFASQPVTSPASAYHSTPSVPQSLFPHHDRRGEVEPIDDTRQLDRAWQIVTPKLQLPSCVSVEDSFGTLPPGSELHSKNDEAEFNAALHVLIEARSLSPRAECKYDVLAWYTQQVTSHFIHHVRPLLAALPNSGPTEGTDPSEVYNNHLVVVQSAVQILEAALRLYHHFLSLILRAVERDARLKETSSLADALMSRFRRDIHALITGSAEPVMSQLGVVLEVMIDQTLEMSRARETLNRYPPVKHDVVETERFRERLLHLVEALVQVGLAGEDFQVLFAEIMNRKMSQYIHRAYARVWKTSARSRSGHGLDQDASKSMNLAQPSWCILSLCDWIENHFARLALEVLSCIDHSGGKATAVSFSDVQQWKEIGVGHIAALRISELFDVVLEWPASKGALDDLKASVTTPQRRWQLTDTFSSALQRRLLHPARSTLDILRVYISMIRTFHALDHSKVLLSRVVPSLQLYLVQREDAVRIVVTGLLASQEEVEQVQKVSTASGGSAPNYVGQCRKLIELAVLLNDPDQQRRVDVDEEDLDWSDMNWVPDPVDAGVNYKRPKSEDVIGTLITTLGSEDIFIKEFQNIIAENLLSTQTDFTQEQKVMDLLKKRFGESALQNCEVMIKDIYDSRKVDTHIRRVELGQPTQPPRAFGTPVAPLPYEDLGRHLDTDEEKLGQVPYHARILSRLYWPNIVQESFVLPYAVEEQQKKYEMGFERLKSARKLTWLNQLGQATVELELEDRTVETQCRTFEAAVIYAFQNDDGAGANANGPARRTIQELQETLQMDEELVLQALEFWVSKGVLVRVSDDSDAFVVLERRSSPTRPELHPSMSAPAALEGEHSMPAKPAVVKRVGTTSAMDAKENERRAMYWQFIVGMLTNSMPTMPLSQMGMMMRMLIADGFPWSDQELQEFLTQKVEMGELEVVGGKYKLVKK